MSGAREKEFKELVTAYADRIFNHAYGILGCREDTEEAVQDIFLKVYRGLPEFRGESDVTTWLYRITYNTCVSSLKKRKVLRTYPDGESEGSSLTWNALIDHDENPEQRLIEKDLEYQIKEALKLLPPEDAEIVALFHIDELKYQEIAAVLNVPLGTVSTKLFRARKKLKAELTFLSKVVER